MIRSCISHISHRKRLMTQLSFLVKSAGRSALQYVTHEVEGFIGFTECLRSIKLHTGGLSWQFECFDRQQCANQVNNRIRNKIQMIGNMIYSNECSHKLLSITDRELSTTYEFKRSKYNTMHMHNFSTWYYYDAICGYFRIFNVTGRKSCSIRVFSNSRRLNHFVDYVRTVSNSI